MIEVWRRGRRPRLLPACLPVAHSALISQSRVPQRPLRARATAGSPQEEGGRWWVPNRGWGLSCIWRLHDVSCIAGRGSPKEWRGRDALPIQASPFLVDTALSSDSVARAMLRTHSTRWSASRPRTLLTPSGWARPPLPISAFIGLAPLLALLHQEAVVALSLRDVSVRDGTEHPLEACKWGSGLSGTHRGQKPAWPADSRKGRPAHYWAHPVSCLVEKWILPVT